VADWQKNLNESIGARLEVDGVFGPATVAATRKFQEQQGIEVDGEVGPISRRAMSRALGAQRGDKPPVVAIPQWPGRLLRPGVTGADVGQWQAQMSKRGHDLEVDGVYGPLSGEACRSIQTEKGLTVDGVVGADTWKATFTPSGD
jgi:peptidoglycan hydrolase-like protein with peptidoglycan-binding domain